MKKHLEQKDDLFNMDQVEVQPLDDDILKSITGGCTGSCSCPSCSDPFFENV